MILTYKRKHGLSVGDHEQFVNGVRIDIDSVGVPLYPRGESPELPSPLIPLRLLIPYHIRSWYNRRRLRMLSFFALNGNRFLPQVAYLCFWFAPGRQNLLKLLLQLIHDSWCTWRFSSFALDLDTLAPPTFFLFLCHVPSLLEQLGIIRGNPSVLRKCGYIQFVFPLFWRRLANLSIRHFQLCMVEFMSPLIVFFWVIGFSPKILFLRVLWVLRFRHSH